MPSFISSSTLVAFQNTTGFSLTGILEGFKNGILGLYMGNVLDILYNLRYWIIVAFFFSALLGFAYKAFYFYRH